MTCTVVITYILQQTWLLFALLIWMGILYYQKRINPIVMIVSMLLMIYVLFLMPHPKPLQDESPLTAPLTGKITSQVKYTSKKTEFTFRTNHTNTLIQVVYFPADNEQPHTLFPDLKHGAVCNVHANSERPSTSTNPAEFNYREYLAKQNIHHQIILQSPHDIACTSESYLNKVFEISHFFQGLIDSTYHSETSAWVKGLVFGDDSGIDKEHLELFRRWSLSHLLAISGLHVGLVMALIYFLLVRLGLFTKEKAGWVMLTFLPLYALMAGGAPSVWRAALMAGLFILMQKWKLVGSLTDVLSVILIIVVGFNPFIIYHIGFQFSFLVTFGLLLSRSWLSETSNSPFYTLLKIGFISQMMILPLQIIYFYTFNPLSILLNVLVVPYFTFFVIPFMFILLAFAPITVLAHKLEMLFVIVHQQILNVLYWVDAHMYAPFTVGTIPIFSAVIYYVFLLWMMHELEGKHYFKAFARGSALVLLLVVLTLRPYVSQTGTVTMLDIGQGDALVIELPYRKGVIVIDAGAQVSFGNIDKSDKVYNQIIKPFLLSKGIDHVDAVFLTHRDWDHIGSVDALVGEFSVGTIYISDYYEIQSDSFKIWAEHAGNVKRVRQGMSLQIGSQPFTILSPGRDWGSPNENSLVLLTELGNSTWLFTGDAGEKVENDIVTAFPDLKIDVLKIGHHGSRTSTKSRFIQEVQPGYGLISAGRNNRYGHPAPEVLEVLDTYGVHVLRTDKDGAVIFQYQDDGGRFLKYVR
nr:DNA internalization-related competence protein ComEC/Rec2 [Lentibacillus sp. JNUCC-1]